MTLPHGGESCNRTNHHQASSNNIAVAEEDRLKVRPGFTLLSLLLTFLLSSRSAPAPALATAVYANDHVSDIFELFVSTLRTFLTSLAIEIRKTYICHPYA